MKKVDGDKYGLAETMLKKWCFLQKELNRLKIQKNDAILKIS